MRHEILNHWDKIKKISKLSNEQLQMSYIQNLSKLSFINEELIPEKTWIGAERLTMEVDVDDTDFVALANYLKAGLWTGDKKLYEGLKTTPFLKVYNTEEMLQFRTKRSV